MSQSQYLLHDPQSGKTHRRRVCQYSSWTRRRSAGKAATDIPQFCQIHGAEICRHGKLRISAAHAIQYRKAGPRVAGQCGVTCAEGGDVILGGAHDAALAQDDLVLLVHGPVPLPCMPHHLTQHIQLNIRLHTRTHTHMGRAALLVHLAKRCNAEYCVGFTLHSS